MQIQSRKSKILNMLRVTEIFRSIQGESTHAGRPCSFIRLTGCPMRCRWCDSEYTFTGGEQMAIEDILTQIRAFGCDLVEVTGGEPLAQKNVFELISQLCDEDFEVLIETGGFVSTERVDARAKIILDVKCPASGEATRNYWQNLERLRKDVDEVKFVVTNLADLQFAGQIIESHDLEHRAKAILISPIFGLENLPEFAIWVAASKLKNVRMQLQLHKYIWGANVHGV
ncbi:MAG: radical SAM protein [Pyrinomonadaceae bacterium]